MSFNDQVCPVSQPPASGTSCSCGLVQNCEILKAEWNCTLLNRIYGYMEPDVRGFCPEENGCPPKEFEALMVILKMPN